LKRSDAGARDGGVTLVIGALFGDEGKGRIAHTLAEDADVVCRFNGGANAAHTVMHNGEKLTLRQVPCGLLHGKRSLVGDGMVLQLDDLAAELAELSARKIDRRKLTISPRAHIVLPTHRLLDKRADEMRGRVGTTLMGIGPALVDKVSRTGLRICDLHERALVRERLRMHAAEVSPLLGKRVNAAQLERDVMKSFARIESLVGETHVILRGALARGERVLVEGAQGTFLDVAWGGYPYVTSTHPTTGGALAALGLPLQSIRDVVGVTRTYTTRQSRGPLPTELPIEHERAFRDATHDYAVRVGWLDMVLVRHAAFLNGFSELVVTGLDKLAGLDTVRLCTSWRIGRKVLRPGDVVPPTFASDAITPVYEDFSGWRSFEARAWSDVPPAAKRFVDRIEQLADTPVRRLSASRAGPLLERMPTP
jgi:adenylosuccinate synthase